MPTGDSQRVWFPEILARLECEWGEAMWLAELIGLRVSLDTRLQQIRSQRHISSPVFTCPKCGRRGSTAEPRVSVRAMILALGLFGNRSRSCHRGFIGCFLRQTMFVHTQRRETVRARAAQATRGTRRNLVALTSSPEWSSAFEPDRAPCQLIICAPVRLLSGYRP